MVLAANISYIPNVHRLVFLMIVNCNMAWVLLYIFVLLLHINRFLVIRHPDEGYRSCQNILVKNDMLLDSDSILKSVINIPSEFLRYKIWWSNCHTCTLKCLFLFLKALGQIPV